MIVVCSLRSAPDEVKRLKARHVVSILSPDTNHVTYDDLLPQRHLRLSFHDIAAAVPGMMEPRDSDMQSLLSFLKSWDRKDPMVIHCWAGISRSTAAGFIAQCLFDPGRSERELAEALREASPSATPNPMMIRMADRALGRGGRMVAAINRIGRGRDAFEGEPFELPVNWT